MNNKALILLVLLGFYFFVVRGQRTTTRPPQVTQGLPPNKAQRAAQLFDILVNNGMSIYDAIKKAREDAENDTDISNDSDYGGGLGSGGGDNDWF